MNLNPVASQFLSAEGLMSLVNPAEAVTLGTPRVLPSYFYTQQDAANANPVGTTVGYYKSNRARRPARVSGQMDASRAAPAEDETFVTVTGIGGRENLPVGYDQLAMLQSSHPIIQRNAVQYVARGVQNFYQRFVELRTAAINSIFAKGKIWVDDDGYILTSSSGAHFTFDPGVPTGNLITKDGSGSTYNIGDWSSDSTSIADAVRGLRQYSIGATGYDLTTVLYGADVPGFLVGNTELKDYFSRNPQFNPNFLENNEIPNGFLGLNWIPAWKAHYVNSANSSSAWFADNFVGFMPNPSNSWYELIPCGTVVPTAGVATSTVTDMPMDASLVSASNIKYGFHAYGVAERDPLIYKVVAGDYFLPALKVPTAYFFGTCS